MSTKIEEYLDSYLNENIEATCAMITGKNCPPCDRMKIVFDRMVQDCKSNGSKVKFIKIDFTQLNNIRLAGKIGFSIEAVPAFAAYRKGKLLSHFTGENKSNLDNLIQSLKQDADPSCPLSSY